MGQGGATTPVDGSVNVDRPVHGNPGSDPERLAGAQQLSFDAAYRYSDYDDLTTDTYKFGLDWAPIDDVRFRGSFQRAVRAANIIELFSPQTFNLFDIAGDPCGARLRTARRRGVHRNRRARKRVGSAVPRQPGGPVPARCRAAIPRCSRKSRIR